VTRPFRTLLFPVSLLALAACEADKTVEPTGIVREVPRTTPPTFDLRPDEAVIGQGSELQLYSVIRNTGVFSVASPNITYSIDSASVASISNTGFVTARAPGTARVTAMTTFGGITLLDSMKITVFAPTIVRELVVEAQPDGWSPSPGHLEAGGTVEWRGGLIAVSGRGVEMVYLMDSRYAIVDSIDLRSGSAKRTFQTRGAVRYCSNACWDPPEHGVFYVH
jgi:hypothetical protein